MFIQGKKTQISMLLMLPQFAETLIKQVLIGLIKTLQRLLEKGI
jgi:hypothetical protein